MAITNGYATLAELKERLGVGDTADDAPLEAVITAVSRLIDEETGRHFYATGSETRYYTAGDHDILFLPDDVLTLTSLATDDDGDRVYETTWASTDYDLEPYNTTPKTMIQLAPNGTRTFPTIRRGVAIVGTFGFNATGEHPDPIREACLILAARFFKRKDAPFGVLGTPEMGIMRITKNDPDATLLLRAYRRMGLGSV